MERILVELRSDPEARRVSGIAMRYGVEMRVGPFRERFEAGAVELRTPALLNIEHDRTQPLAVCWFTDGAEVLELTATLDAGPRQDQALADVRSGRYKGLSIEFRALAQRFEAGVRIIERAIVAGAGLAESPAYDQTTIEARSTIWAGERGGVSLMPIGDHLAPPRPPAQRELLRWL